jgi:hypothetical protein
MGEYHVNKCVFSFSEEYTSDLVIKAIFDDGINLKEMVVVNGECNIPYEVLNSKKFTLGVYAFEIDNEELVLRYSPTPTNVFVREGSYQEGATAGEEITPTQFEQYEQALNDGLQEVANVNIDAEQTEDGASVTITNREGVEKTVQILNGQDGEPGQPGAQGLPGKDATINGVNTLNITAGTNIDLTQTGNTLQINNTYDDSQLIQDISTNATNISNEVLNRQNADIGLQGQIDAITASSDVVDIVGTYQDLQNYDTQHLGNNDVIKVLQDSTHNDAMTYYRWLKNSSTWQYIGQEGPYYTKSEIDNTLQGYVEDSDLTDYVKNTDYASISNNKGGVVVLKHYFATDTNASGVLYCVTKNYTQYQSMEGNAFISKGTLENVLNARIGDISSVLDSINVEVI